MWQITVRSAAEAVAPSEHHRSALLWMRFSSAAVGIRSSLEIADLKTAIPFFLPPAGMTTGQRHSVLSVMPPNIGKNAFPSYGVQTRNKMCLFIHRNREGGFRLLLAYPFDRLWIWAPSSCDLFPAKMRLSQLRLSHKDWLAKETRLWKKSKWKSWFCDLVNQFWRREDDLMRFCGTANAKSLIGRPTFWLVRSE